MWPQRSTEGWVVEQLFPRFPCLNHIHIALFFPLPGQVRRGGTAVQEGTEDLGEILGAGSSECCDSSQQPGGVVRESGACRGIFLHVVKNLCGFLTSY